MNQHLPLPLILQIVGVLLGGSAIIAALITARSARCLKQSDLVSKISEEVRADLRKELAEAEAVNKALLAERIERQRLLERVIDNLLPFTQNVARLCHTVSRFLPAKYKPLADTALADARRLLKLLGEVEEAKRLDDVPAMDSDPPPEEGEPSSNAPPEAPPEPEPTVTATVAVAVAATVTVPAPQAPDAPSGRGRCGVCPFNVCPFDECPTEEEGD